jgi:WhiB family transcriptional regulator, redox-sensing transcriptional regulator
VARFVSGLFDSLPKQNTWSQIHRRQMADNKKRPGSRGPDMSSLTCERTKLAVPCHVEDPDLWFADNPRDLEHAKALCAECPIRRECLTAALERQEPWGVWGGEILDRGTVIARKRPRGRPRKDTKEPVAA